MQFQTIGVRHNCVAAFSGSKRNARELARKRPRLITLRVRVRRIDSQINLLYSPRVLLLLPCAQCKRFVVPTIARGKKAYGNLNELIRSLSVFRKRGTTLSSLFFTRRLTSGRGPSFPSLSSMQITRLRNRDGFYDLGAGLESKREHSLVGHRRNLRSGSIFAALSPISASRRILRTSASPNRRPIRGLTRNLMTLNDDIRRAAKQN